MKRIATLLFALVVVNTSLFASAQVQIQFYSSFTNGSIPAECKAEAAVISPLLTLYHSPSWTWIIACDEGAWHQVEMHTGQANVSGKILGMTDLENHITYIRGFAVLNPFNDSIDAQASHTVAHELGHIVLNTSNESKAEKKAKELMGNTASLVASK